MGILACQSLRSVLCLLVWPRKVGAARALPLASSSHSLSGLSELSQVSPPHSQSEVSSWLHPTRPGEATPPPSHPQRSPSQGGGLLAHAVDALAN